MNLARKQCDSDCCENGSISTRHESDINTVYFGKMRRQLYMECLAEEDMDELNGSSNIKSNERDKKHYVSKNNGHNVNAEIQGKIVEEDMVELNNSSNIKSRESDKKHSLSNNNDRKVNAEIQGKVSHLEIRTINSSPFSGQRVVVETDPEPVEMPSMHGKSEGSSSIPHNSMCNVSKSEESYKSAVWNMKGSLVSAGRQTVISYLKTQLESSEQGGQFLHMPTEATQSLDAVSTLQPNLVPENMEHDMLENNNISLSLHQTTVFPPPTFLPTYDLNVSNVDPSGTSIYRDIVTILKVLEQEETCSCHEMFLNTHLLDTTQNVPVTSGKLCDILTYLDEVEHCCDATLESAKNQLQAMEDITKNTELKLITVPRVEELLNLSTVDLAHEVLKLHLQLEEKSNSINLLQEMLNQQRELIVHDTRNTDCDKKAKLHEQEEEYEAAIARHQKFIDQLITDKKILNEKCETLVLELKKSEEHHANTLKAVEERHSVALQRAREMHAAAEKLRRERWIDNKKQKIKEMTVKSLEPELQRMNTRHQQELSDLRALHKMELDQLELKASQKTTQQMEQLRDQLTAEKEEALAKEKELLRQRYKTQKEQEELEFQAQQHRFFTEICQEKERLAEEETRMNQELEETKQNLYRENAKVIERLKQKHQEAMEACTRRHQIEMKSLKEALEIEKEAWMQSYKKDQATHVSERVLEISNHYKRERDKEIELVIERLESEATQSRAELEQAMDNRFRRFKERFDAEIKDLEASEKVIKSKYNEVKSKLIEKEDEITNLKANARQLEKEVAEAKKIVDRLSEERAEVKKVAHEEFVNQMTAAEQENIRLREKISELRTRLKLELSGKVSEVARIMAEKERQLQHVYSRVKSVITKRDETIQKLMLQLESALERCSHVEELLEQQRQDFLHR